MPFGGLDFITILRRYPVDRCLHSRHECRTSRPHLDAMRRITQSPTVCTHCKRQPARIEIANLDKTILGVQARISCDARVCCPDVLRPPVVVHFVDTIDQDKAWLRIVVGRTHDHVPDVTCGYCFINLAGDTPGRIDHISLSFGPFAPDDQPRIVQIRLPRFVRINRKSQRPWPILLDGLHEVPADQQGQIELPEPSIFPLGTNELENIRVSDIEGSHLCSATTPCGGDGETHPVVDIHERKRA